MRQAAFAAATLLAATAALPARAQFESSALAKVQVNVTNPGGKSLAMGGAFVALADDATAAFANPAGLVQLGSWQVGASVKGFRFAPNFDTRVFAAEAQGTGEAFVQVGSVPFQPTTTVTELPMSAYHGNAMTGPGTILLDASKTYVIRTMLTAMPASA